MGNVLDASSGEEDQDIESRMLIRTTNNRLLRSYVPRPISSKPLCGLE